MYQDREDKTVTKINDLKQTNADATGLQKLEDELVKIRAEKEKLTKVYNDLVK
jgi:hypothetical protein